MNRNTKWILFVAIIATISLLWPLSYVFRHSPPTKNNQTEDNNIQVIGTIEKYTANIDGNVTSVSPELIIVAYSNFGSRHEISDKIKSFGASEVNVTRKDSDNDNYLYRFDILAKVNNSSDTGRVYFLANRFLNMTIASAFSPANVSLPDNATFSGDYGTRVIAIPKDTLTFVYPGTSLGETKFRVYLEMTSGKIARAIAVGGTPFFIPPMETEYEPLTGRILSVDKVVIKAAAGEVNTTKLENEWNASVSFDNGTLLVESSINRANELYNLVSKSFNITSEYYLATAVVDLGNNTFHVVDIPVTDINQTEVNFTGKITKAYGYVVGVSYYS